MPCILSIYLFVLFRLISDRSLHLFFERNRRQIYIEAIFFFQDTLFNQEIRFPETKDISRTTVTFILFNATRYYSFYTSTFLKLPRNLY